MVELAIGEILKAVNGRLLSGNADGFVYSVSTDSRTIAAGALFIPLRGKNFDGYVFIFEAAGKGAVAVFVENESFPAIEGVAVILVGNNLRALGDLAAYYRRKMNPVVIAVTGSVGKTGTKNMIVRMLGTCHRVRGTSGNYNNEIGLPLTVFSLEREDEFLVVEMGMSALGEIARLTEIADPDCAVITMIGISHIEHLGSIDNIAKAKGELFFSAKKSALLVINADDERISAMASGLTNRKISFGYSEGADIRILDVKTDEEGKTLSAIEIFGRRYDLSLGLCGAHHVRNAAAALAAGIMYLKQPELAIDSLAGMASERQRTEILEIAGVTVINDCYNASPQSMKAALDLLGSRAANGKKLAVLGDMLELGGYSEEAHREIGAYSARAGIDALLGIGRDAVFYVEAAKRSGRNSLNAHHFGTFEEAKDSITKGIGRGDLVLVKGSRGMRMERVVELIKNYFGGEK
ncbi:MAG: UDP-N-acetylmuramoyl-tripeptide--D-alanyl-D-alanine ligase [Deltaproteobacteria bacterium]|nr:UDP-N-acetylmuramoyl-tripeptide--D-alanyl-D-alanine ligase [Deltaproteobacteria bacterium]